MLKSWQITNTFLSLSNLILFKVVQVIKMFYNFYILKLNTYLLALYQETTP